MEYFAFISYQRKDEEWAKWLANELEHYHLPLTLNGRNDLPRDLRPIFRDIDELSAGNLPHQIHEALECSKHLIVICSPRSAKSPWVNKEIETFIGMGKTDKIFPFIIEGTAMCKKPNDPKECFPPALRKLPKNEERLGANVNENGHGNKLRTCDDCPIKEERFKKDKQSDINDKGRDAAVVKIVAGMLGLGFDTLWQRYEREKAEEERKIREQRDKLLIVQSRFLAEKANDLVDKGDSYTARLLALEALPKDLENPDRPYVSEAENALRKAFSTDNAIISWGNDTEEQDNLVYNAKIKMLISSSQYDNHVNFWDLESGCLAYQIDSSGDIYSLAISSDGKLLATTDNIEHFYCDTEYLTDDDRAISIWDINSHKLNRKIKGPENLVTSLDFDSNNRFLVSVEAYSNSFKIWSLEDDDCLYIVRKQKQICISAKFCCNNNLIVSLWNEPDNDTYNIALWNMEKAKFVNKMTYKYPPTKLAMSSDGNLFAVVFEEPSGFPIYVYDIHLFQEVCKLEGHQDYVNSISFNEAGQQLVSCSKDSSIKVWSLESKFCLYTFQMPTVTIGVLNACFISNNIIVSSSEDKTIRIWDHALSFLSGPDFILRSHTSWVGCLSYDKDGSKLVSSSGDGTIKIWNPETGTLLRTMYGPIKAIDCVSFNHKGNIIASGSRDKSINIWGVNGEKLGVIYDAHEDDILSISFSKDDKFLVSTSYDNIVKVWYIKTRTLICSKKFNGLTSAQCSPVDDYILVSHGNDICLLDMQCKLLRSFSNHNEDVCGVVFNAKGNMFASFSEDCTIRIWDLDSIKPKMILQDDNYICSASFSPDDMRLVTTSGYEWNNDGEYLRIWDLKTGGLIETLEGGIHTTKQMFAVYSPDGRTIASASYDGTISIWKRNSLSFLIEETRKRFKNRQLTAKERKKYYLD